MSQDTPIRTGRPRTPKLLIAVDLLAIPLALLLSFLIRFEEGSQSMELFAANWPALLIALTVKPAIYWRWGLYAASWRFASLPEARRIAEASIISSLLFILANFVVLEWFDLTFIFSRGVLVLDLFLSAGFLAGSRAAVRGIQRRKYNDRPDRRDEKRVLIVGATELGDLAARMMRKDPTTGYVPVGFVDDDIRHHGSSIHGVRVLGNTKELPMLIEKTRSDEIVVAVGDSSSKEFDDTMSRCASLDLPIRVIPGVRDLLTGSLNVDQLRRWRIVEDEDSHASGQEDMNFDRLMVTGGAGFIGSNFVHHMLGKYPNLTIVVYDKLTYAGNPANLDGLTEKCGDRFVFVKGDICDQSLVESTIAEHGIQAIVNFAAETHVDRSLMTPDAFLRTNVFGTYVLLEATRKHNLMRYLQVSTDEVYGEVEHGAFVETDPLETRSPYSASKAAGDLLVRAFHTSFGVPVIITRGSNSIGPRQYPEKVVPLFITSALEGRPLPVYGDGGYVRDYQYVVDHCRGIDIALRRGRNGEAYNLGSGNEMAALELAKKILKALGKPESMIRMVEDRPGQDRRYALSCAKIKALGWTQEWNFDRALHDTIEWYLANEQWWRAIKNDDYWEFYKAQYEDRLKKGTLHSAASPT
ncbi:MAG: dTDP-glucose 4,6-dehydratase [Myxococcales bacterium]|nr:dTDP-glucose 4,6-dehydratase [Myxococcales bacterium]